MHADFPTDDTIVRRIKNSVVLFSLYTPPPTPAVMGKAAEGEKWENNIDEI